MTVYTINFLTSLEAKLKDVEERMMKVRQLADKLAKAPERLLEMLHIAGIYADSAGMMWEQIAASIRKEELAGLNGRSKHDR